MTDRYTKAVLTIIAISLVALVAQNAVRPLSAQNVTRVVLCDAEDPSVCASLGKVPGLRNAWGLVVLEMRHPLQTAP